MKLERPLCTFDIETTGLNIALDRIVSIAVMKITPDGEVEEKYRLINPERPIPSETTEIHGISDEMVANEPTFKQIAKALHEFMSDCDLAGYNAINFDLPLLSEEFARCELPFPSSDQRLLDAGVIFKNQERRTLEAAMQFYCDEELEDAHNAKADVAATFKVLEAQVEKYGWSDLSIEDLANESSYDKRADLAGKLVRDDDGDVAFAFGKAKGTKVKDDVGFARWMLGKDFTSNTKNVLLNELKKHDLIELK